jgi:hypothetical protein
LSLILGLTPHPVLALDRALLPLNSFVKDLWVENNHSSFSTIWISGPVIIPGQTRETSFVLRAGERSQISLAAFAHQPWLLIKTNRGDKLQVHVITSKLKILELPWGISNTYEDSIAPTQTPLYLTNPHPFPVLGSLKLGIKKIPFRIEPESVLKLYREGPTQTRVEVRSDYRVSALYMGDSVLRRPALSKQVVPMPAQKGRFFLFENDSRNQSFVAELTEPTHILQAQLQIKNPQQSLPRILVAQARMKHHYHNRNWQHPSKAPWNWSVEEVFRFADLAMQECDGSPEFLDEILPYWVAGGGLICFWNYKVTRELTPEQVALGKD